VSGPGPPAAPADTPAHNNARCYAPEPQPLCLPAFPNRYAHNLLRTALADRIRTVKQERREELSGLRGSPCASSLTDDTEAARDEGEEGDEGDDDDFMPSRASSKRWGTGGLGLGSPGEAPLGDARAWPECWRGAARAAVMGLPPLLAARRCPSCALCPPSPSRAPRGDNIDRLLGKCVEQWSQLGEQQVVSSRGACAQPQPQHAQPQHDLPGSRSRLRASPRACPGAPARRAQPWPTRAPTAPRR
jgi:hypothetical protein